MTRSARGFWPMAVAVLALTFAEGCKSSSSDTPSAPSVTPPSISGTVSFAAGSTMQPVAGAQVCAEGTTTCTTSASDGSYALGGLTPGQVFLSASASGFLPGETRESVTLASGAAVTGVALLLSGRPPDSAHYVGSGLCFYCHESEVLAWQSSAHSKALDQTTQSVDVTGWPAAPSDCTGPAQPVNSSIQQADPMVAPPADPTRDVYLVRWKAGCGQPEFAMAFDTNGNGIIDAGDTVIPVTGSIGGVATDAGQCGNGGILPAQNPCASNLGGSHPTAAMGWWQQEYLTAIGGSAKPSWVTWDTSGTPTDALVMPLAWNQRTQQWVAAPDYNTAQTGTWSMACAGCHEVGLTLAVDANGLVTQYASVSPQIGCEKCHGPASAHVTSLDPKLIVNPAYLTAQAAREVCAQCHSQGVSSASPAGVFGFAWNDAATVGGGNFIPGVHQLSDFMSAPSFGDPNFYWTESTWPAGTAFPSSDHLTAIDLGSSQHATNTYDRLTCGDCHTGHAGAGGPTDIASTDAQTGDRYDFLNNDAVLRDDVGCLTCHAGFGSFASVALSDTAAYHLSMGGTVEKNGAAWTISSGDQATAVANVASTVTAHMVAKSGCTAPFDPTGTNGPPAGRCSSCHMAKTTFTGSYFSGLDSSGKMANVIGDVSAHTFVVATPDLSQATVAAATTWDGVMPNACGACHAEDRFGL